MLESVAELFLRLNTVLNDTVFMFNIVSWSVAIKLEHRSLRKFRVALACVVDVGLRNPPDHQNENLAVSCQYGHRCHDESTQLTPVKMNSVATNGLHSFGR